MQVEEKFLTNYSWNIEEKVAIIEIALLLIVCTLFWPPTSNISSLKRCKFHESVWMQCIEAWRVTGAMSRRFSCSDFNKFPVSSSFQKAPTKHKMQHEQWATFMNEAARLPSGCCVSAFYEFLWTAWPRYKASKLPSRFRVSTSLVEASAFTY